MRFDEWPTYFVDLALMDGFGVLALVLIGIGVLVWRLRRTPRSRADLLLAGSLLVPLALYSVYSTGEVRLRHFSLAIPWVMLTAAVGDLVTEAKECATRHKIHVVLAAQLARPPASLRPTRILPNILSTPLS